MTVMPPAQRESVMRPVLESCETVSGQMAALVGQVDALPTGIAANVELAFAHVMTELEKANASLRMCCAAIRKIANPTAP